MSSAIRLPILLHLLYIFFSPGASLSPSPDRTPSIRLRSSRFFGALRRLLPPFFKVICFYNLCTCIKGLVSFEPEPCIFDNNMTLTFNVIHLCLLIRFNGLSLIHIGLVLLIKWLCYVTVVCTRILLESNYTHHVPDCLFYYIISTIIKFKLGRALHF